MNSKAHLIHTSPFVEIIAMTKENATNIDFDIIIEGEMTLQTYCDALMNKVFHLKLSQFINFINYHCEKYNDAMTWLNKFEKLLTNNAELFTSKCGFVRISKLINLIELKRKELQDLSVVENKSKTPKRLINAEAEERYFSFH